MIKYLQNTDTVDISVIKNMLNENINVNMQDENGWTALMCASCEGHKDIVELLKQN